MNRSPRRSVLITGGGGRIGTLLARELAESYALTLLDIQPPPDRSLPFVRADIADYAAIRPHFNGVETVVHLAANPWPDASWEKLCLHIGFLTAPASPALTPWNKQLELMITPRDLLQLFACCLEAPAGLRFGIFHGLSGSPWPRFDLTEAEQVLGYHPQDDLLALARRNYSGIIRQVAGGLWSRGRRLLFPPLP